MKLKEFSKKILVDIGKANTLLELGEMEYK